MNPGKLHQEKWATGVLNRRNTPHKGTGLSRPWSSTATKSTNSDLATNPQLSTEWHQQVAEYDKRIGQGRESADRFRRGQPPPPLSIGDPIVIQNRTSKRWDRYGVIQERNLKIGRYTVRLPSGLITIRNRRHIRVRYPPVKRLAQEHRNGQHSMRWVTTKMNLCTDTHHWTLLQDSTARRLHRHQMYRLILCQLQLTYLTRFHRLGKRVSRVPRYASRTNAQTTARNVIPNH